MFEGFTNWFNNLFNFDDAPIVSEDPVEYVDLTGQENQLGFGETTSDDYWQSIFNNETYQQIVGGFVGAYQREKTFDFAYEQATRLTGLIIVLFTAYKVLK